ncbi:MAG: phosphate acyltransferase [Planctomycetota bacterium]
MNPLLQKLYDRARGKVMRIVFPEGLDERLVATAAKARDLGIARPILCGKPDEVKAVAAKAGVDLTGIPIHDPENDPLLDAFAAAYAVARDVKPVIAKKLVRKPLLFGGMLVREGHADGMVAGAANTTAAVIQAAGLTIGLAPGVDTATSYFVMVVPEFMGEKDKPFVFADCAVNIQPSAKQLGVSGVIVGRDAGGLLGITPKVAYLSCSTKGSASHADVDKVTQAVAIAHAMKPEFDVDGELQGDAALVPRVAAKKVKESSVAGKANVLIFPDLDAGNIAYKLTQYLAGALALGPILVGFNRPVNDLSRGAVVDDIVGVTAITAVRAQQCK